MLKSMCKAHFPLFPVLVKINMSCECAGFGLSFLLVSGTSLPLIHRINNSENQYDCQL